MGFQQGLSGVGAAAKQLDVIGNNVANSSTVGFKQSRAEFADMFAASYYGVAATQNGIGTTVQAVAQQMNQGNITITNNQMDLAISGNGFFITQTPTGTAYTRNGQFQVDKDGFVVNNGDKLMGWGPVKDSNPVKMREGELQALKVDTSMIAPVASDGGAASAADPRKISLPTQLDSRLPVIASAFNVDDPTTYNNSTSGTLYDSLGNPLTLTTYYKKTGQDQWDVYARINNPNMPTVSTTGSGSAANNPVMLSGSGTVAGTGVTVTPVNLSFNTDGSLASPTDGFAAFGTYGSIAGANPLVVTLDIGTSKDVGTTQFARTFSNKGFDQVGYAAAELTGLQVDKTGIMKARYSNGKTKDIGQVVLSNFKNPQGLQAIGANRWIETLASGSSILNNPGSSNVGLVQSGAVEDSNVDLTSELVNMITAQRFYQANAQTIKVQDAVMQTLINLR
jgi:flagellar hook protein FlgE